MNEMIVHIHAMNKEQQECVQQENLQQEQHPVQQSHEQHPALRTISLYFCVFTVQQSRT